MSDTAQDGPKGGNELLPFLDWLLARLCADPTIAARAWLDGTAPQNTPKPFVAVSLASSPDSLSSGGVVSHTRPLVQVKVMADNLDPTFPATRALVQAINRLCARVGQVIIPPIDAQSIGVAIQGSHRENPIFYTTSEEIGGSPVRTLHIGGRFRFFLQTYP